MAKEDSIELEKKEDLGKMQIQKKKVALGRPIDCTQWVVDWTCQQEDTEKNRQLSLSTKQH